MPPLTDADADLPVIILTLAGLTANGAVTVADTVLLLPALSFTVIVVAPVATPVIVTVVPFTDAVAIWALPEVAVYGACPPEIVTVPVFPDAIVRVDGDTARGAGVGVGEGCGYAIVVAPNPTTPVTCEYAILK